MAPEPHEPAERPDPDRTPDRKPAGDPEREPDTEPPVADDGSVPEKQIQRWKEEGGSWTPAE